MKISVVTISYNQAGYLKQCLDSVLGQNYSDIEYIVVDPGSTDGSRDIINSYGDRIIKVFELDDGPADGLNKGFSKATGDIFYFINSDDFVFQGAFSRVLNEFEKNPSVDIVLAGGNAVDREGKIIKSFYPSKMSPKAYVNGAVTLFQQGMFFRARVFKNSGGFNSTNSTCWDGELLMQFSLANARIVRLMRKVAAFRIYPESITGSQRFSAQYEIDRKRMFSQVYGTQVSINLLVKYLYRIQKIISDPSYVYKRFLG